MRIQVQYIADVDDRMFGFVGYMRAASHNPDGQILF
jgi:hypothetical protein